MAGARISRRARRRRCSGPWPWCWTSSAVVVDVVDGALDRLALAVDAPPVGADDEHDVDAGDRRVLDELADPAEVAGHQLGLGQRARGVPHQRLRRVAGALPAAPGPNPRSWSSASVLPASPALAGAVEHADDRVGLADRRRPWPGRRRRSAGGRGAGRPPAAARRGGPAGTSTPTFGSVSISSAPSCFGSTLRNVFTSRRMLSLLSWSSIFSFGHDRVGDVERVERVLAGLGRRGRRQLADEVLLAGDPVEVGTRAGVGPAPVLLVLEVAGPHVGERGVAVERLAPGERDVEARVGVARRVREVHGDLADRVDHADERLEVDLARSG